VTKAVALTFPAPTLTLALSLGGRGDRCNPHPWPIGESPQEGGRGYSAGLKLPSRPGTPIIVEALIVLNLHHSGAAVH
jgi:hypothetical protein